MQILCIRKKQLGAISNELLVDLSCFKYPHLQRLTSRFATSPPYRCCNLLDSGQLRYLELLIAHSKSPPIKHDFLILNALQHCILLALDLPMYKLRPILLFSRRVSLFKDNNIDASLGYQNLLLPSVYSHLQRHRPLLMLMILW